MCLIANDDSLSSCFCHLIQLNSKEQILQDFVLRNRIREDLVEFVEESWYKDESLEFKATWALLRKRIIHNQVYHEKMPLTPLETQYPKDSNATSNVNSEETIVNQILGNDICQLTEKDLEKTLNFFNTSTTETISSNDQGLKSSDTINSFQDTSILKETSTNSPNVNKTPKAKKTKSTPKRKRNPSWPKQFDFPLSELPDYLIKKLNKRGNLIESDYRQLIDGFYNKIINDFNM